MNRGRFLSSGLAGVAAAVVAVAVGGCASRPQFWDVGVSGTVAVGLANGVALVDDADHQVVVLTSRSATPPDLVRSAYPVGHHVASVQQSADGSTLFVLSTGDSQPTSAAGRPSLTTIQIDSMLNVTAQSYPMLEACQSLAVDPEGEWAVAYQQVGFVENENELIIFDLTGAHSAPVTLTLQSFGGTPQQLTFTPSLLVDPSLGVPAGDRRLLIVETQIDVSILDLDHVFDNPQRPEITVPLTSSTTGQQVTPAGVAVDAFSSTSASDAQFALRASDSSDVFTFTFGPPDPGAANDFKPIPNETPVGGVPSDMAFVHDQQGNVGLAVLVPSSEAAVLVQPATSTTSSVTLPSPYSNLSLVTNAISTTSGGDVALLWNGGIQSGVALWTVGEPYFSVEVTGVSAPIETVLDVPDSSFKVLEPSDGSGFFVLDLGSGRVTPLNTTTQATLSISSDGQRLWAFVEGGTDLACIALSPSFSPIDLTTVAPIDSAYDIGGAAGSRDLVALDMEGTIGATVFDALHPQAPPRRIPALLLGEP